MYRVNLIHHWRYIKTYASVQERRQLQIAYQ